MLKTCGLKNVIDEKLAYPIVTESQISTLNPDFIFLSSEPYPFKEKHIIELQNICLNTTIILVDGEYFSWYGSRLLNAPDYFKDLIHKIG